uniref:Uncharacterized protein n=1 Tax=Oryza glumipatula TaxID=40148 RepID=A0A0E0AAR6_9ORYZ
MTMTRTRLRIFGRCWVWGFVTTDLLLMENQIPFFKTNDDDVLVTGTLRLFRSLRPQKLYSSPTISCIQMDAAAAPKAPAPDDIRHHAVPLPPSELSQWIPCARELEEAGIRFLTVASWRSPSCRPLEDYSEPLFRNLIAFEQTRPFTPGHVTAYAIFMDSLVTSPEDMRLLLIISGVLVN